ncbi:YlzJ-like family protein [Peribacillus kribbensis]|uniref:YlzJ-like family protein n=1 Tax=Peribacillus kribbensis TaxID=356658 RepID=UPI000403D74B|nr:YlzJ-like family protein [Peribacillus kribbensis]
MILYTTMPHELMLGQEMERYPDCMEIDYRGIQLEVQMHSPFCFRVERIISTEPGHYLIADIQPGSFLQYSPSDFAR